MLTVKRRMAAVGAALVLVLALLLVSRPDAEQYRPRIEVIGDVQTALAFTDLTDIDPESGERIALDVVLAVCEPREADYSVLLVGTDGLVARVDQRLEETWLQFSREHGWEIRDALHPVSAQIKHLAQIIVVSESDRNLTSVGVESREAELLRVTPGALALLGPSRSLHWEGSSSIDRESGTYEVDIYTSDWTYPLAGILEADSRLWISGRDGSVGLHRGVGELVLAGNRIDYRDGDYLVEDLAGILVEAPVASVADAYEEALYYIGKDIPVMLLFLDGFSYRQYEFAAEEGLIPFLAGCEKPAEAVSFYKPVTNVGFAAMISGQGPEENQIHSREDRVLQSSIFKVLAEQGKEALLLEGDIRILDAGAEERLHVDKNGDGSVDDEIFASAQEALGLGYDYLLVHFHAIDDAGHSHGPYGEETLAQIALHDRYAAELSEQFAGKVIVVADHGMHETDDGGTHGLVSWDDLVVPYLVMDGGLR